jgi:hypothetical protein
MASVQSPSDVVPMDESPPPRASAAQGAANQSSSQTSPRHVGKKRKGSHGSGGKRSVTSPASNNRSRKGPRFPRWSGPRGSELFVEMMGFLKDLRPNNSKELQKCIDSFNDEHRKADSEWANLTMLNWKGQYTELSAERAQGSREF